MILDWHEKALNVEQTLSGTKADEWNRWNGEDIPHVDFLKFTCVVTKEVRLVVFFFSLSLGFVLIFEFYLVNCGLLLVD